MLAVAGGPGVEGHFQAGEGGGGERVGPDVGGLVAGESQAACDFGGELGAPFALFFQVAGMDLRVSSACWAPWWDGCSTASAPDP